MAWLKSSDTAANHPIVIAPLAWPPADLDGLEAGEMVALLFGIVNRCAVYSAQYTTDYVIADGVVALMCGARWQLRAEQAARAGYWSRVEGGWLLVDDAEHLFHIRRRAEIEWERARKLDISNTRLVVPVRLRDGDGCRYCGVIVQWNARRGGRAATYDHRNPGQRARTPEDLVVCCASCNGQRGSNPDLAAWPLRPAPAQPFYGELTAGLLAEHGYQVPIGARPRIQRDTAPRDLAPRETPRTDRPSDLQNPPGSTDRGSTADRNPGRDGTGRSRARRGRQVRGRRDHRRGGDT